MPLSPQEQRELEELELQELEEQEAKASKPEPFTPGSWMDAAKKSAEAYQSPEGVNSMAGALAGYKGLSATGSAIKGGSKAAAGALADLLQGPSLSDKAKGALADLLRGYAKTGASEAAPATQQIASPISPRVKDLFSGSKR